MKEKLLNIMSRLFTPLFIISTTITAIIINFNNNLEGSNVSTSNVIASVIFVALWTILSIYKGIKKDKKYFYFYLVYWSVPVLLMAAVAIANNNNYIDTTAFILPIIGL